MQGGGEVVMLRGLRDKEVTIALVCADPIRPGFIGKKSPTRTVQSNVETNTDVCYTDSAVQIDGSSFKKNDTYSMEYPPPPKWEHPQRSSAISRMFHNTDAFAESLRKYPNPGLEKSQSDEIVQRILSYAQGRSFSKKSKSRSMRSLLYKSSNHKRSAKRSIGVVTSSVSLLFGRSSSLVNTRPEIDTRYNYLNTSMSKPGLEVRYLTGLKRAICTKLLDLCDDSPKICPKIKSRFSNHKRHCRSRTFQIKPQDNKSIEVQAISPRETRDASVEGTCHGIETHAEKKQKSCFCQTPEECVCKTKSTERQADNKQDFEDILKKLVPGLDLNEPEDLPSRVEKLIKEWINQVPPFYNVDISSDQKEGFIRRMINELKDIENLNIADVKQKTVKCLNDIPDLQNKRESLVNDMSENLTNKLKYLLVQDEWQHNIADLVSDILSKYDISDKNKQLITKAVAQKLKPVIMNRALPKEEFKQYLTDEIIGLVQQLPLDVTEHITQLSTKKSMDKGIPRSSRGRSFDGGKKEGPVSNIEDAVLDWLEDVPELSNLPIHERKKLIAPLVKSLAKSKNPEMKKGIVKKWLNDVVNKDGTLSSRSINKLTRKLVSKLQPMQGANRDRRVTVSHSVSPSQEGPDKKERMKDNIFRWLQDIPQLNMDLHKNKLAVENLENTLNELAREGNTNEISPDTRSVIKDWLTNLLRDNNIRLPRSNIDNLVNNLVKKIRENAPTVSSYAPRASRQDLDTEVMKWLKNSVNVNATNLDKYKQAVQKLVSDLEDIKSKQYDDRTLKRMVNNAIRKWVHKLNEETGAVIPPRERQNLTESVLSQMRRAPNNHIAELPRGTNSPSPSKKSSRSSSRQEKQSYPNQLAPKSRKKWKKVQTPKRDIHNGVTKVLDKYSSNYMKKTKGELISRITDEVEKKLNDIPKPTHAETKAPISHILRDYTKFSDKDIDDIASAVVDKIVGFSTPYIPRNKLTSDYKDGGRNYESHQEYASEEESDKIYTDDSKNTDEDEQPKTLQKHKVFKNIAKDISQNIDKFLGQNEDQPQRATSTPDREIEPSLESLSIPSIHEINNESEVASDTHREETGETMPVKRILSDWLRELDIDENLKNKIITELAEDILDRQKYLKLSNSKVRKSAELEHLKFQVFKRLNNVVSDRELTHFMGKIEDLAERLNLFSSGSNGETPEASTYKKQLRIIISQTFPFIHDESFEVFKHDLADAFVSLHFCADDQTARSKYRIKIQKEINTFCNNYLKHYPGSQLDVHELNRELYIALLQVPVPSKELLEPSYNISLIQEEVQKWLSNSHPPEPISMNTRDRISILSTNIYNLQNNPSNKDLEIFKTISDWLKEYSFVSGKHIDIATEAKALHYNIRHTQASSPRNEISINVTQNVDNQTKKENGTQYTPFMPQSNLSAEDRAYLNRIRARQQLNEIQNSQVKYVDTSSPPVTTSTQTIPDRPVERAVNVDISPQVLVKEYHWDSEPSRVHQPFNTSNINELTQPQNINQSTYLSSHHVSNPQQTQSQDVNSTEMHQIHVENRNPQITVDSIGNRHPNIEINKRPVIAGFPAPFERKSTYLSSHHVSNPQQTQSQDVHSTGMHEIHIENRNPQIPTDSIGNRHPNIEINKRPVIAGFPAPFERMTFQRPFELRQESKMVKCCKCGARVITKCRSRNCQHHNRMCSRCYSGACPHPAQLYFHRQF
ncbi:uncharacterized protein LOC125062845 isoform X2 [Pieris napi]|uniref:uncharacterized protein LOC125062845 isoform X2 n=1 Tax=Pieris napi TaxID=78633 RepID=UPI001FBB822F|nr:uncharacterized protein LOC125062845 isoform X2 [Pieris napi]